MKWISLLYKGKCVFSCSSYFLMKCSCKCFHILKLKFSSLSFCITNRRDSYFYAYGDIENQKVFFLSHYCVNVKKKSMNCNCCKELAFIWGSIKQLFILFIDNCHPFLITIITVIFSGINVKKIIRCNYKYYK